MAAPLIHFSVKPLTAVRSVPQSMRADRGDKPDGLWFSAGDGEDGWRAWCASEMPEWIKGCVETEIVLATDARVLRIVGAAEIDTFTKEYGIVPAWAEGISSFGGDRTRAIDWQRVASEYQAIIIAPYVWARRLNGGANWYYPWDCASGCVWDSAAVAALKQRTTELVE